jgi:hypothetical protein
MCDRVVYKVLVCTGCKNSFRKADDKDLCSTGRKEGFGKKCKVTTHEGKIRHNCPKK